jgi:hypothetical protein
MELSVLDVREENGAKTVLATVKFAIREENVKKGR